MGWRRTRGCGTGWSTSCTGPATRSRPSTCAGTVAPWLTLARHLLVLRGLWDHHPSELYASISVPVLLIPAAGGFSATDEAVGLLPRGRVHPLTGDHDLHAQHPALVAEVLHGA